MIQGILCRLLRHVAWSEFPKPRMRKSAKHLCQHLCRFVRLEARAVHSAGITGTVAVLLG